MSTDIIAVYAEELQTLPTHARSILAAMDAAADVRLAAEIRALHSICTALCVAGLPQEVMLASSGAESIVWHPDTAALWHHQGATSTMVTAEAVAEEWSLYDIARRAVEAMRRAAASEPDAVRAQAQRWNELADRVDAALSTGDER